MKLLLIKCFLLTLLISGCDIGPKYERPKTVVDNQSKYNNAHNTLYFTNDPNNLAKPDKWWHHFNDPVINKYVVGALTENIDLKTKAWQVIVAQEMALQAGADRSFSADLTFYGDRSRRAFHSPAGLSTFDATTYSPMININYATDFFGKYTSTQLNRKASLHAEYADQRALYHIIIATVIKSRIRINTLQQQLENYKESVINWQKSYDVASARYRENKATPSELRSVESSLANAKEKIPNTEQDLIKEMYVLDTLLGQPAGTTTNPPMTLPMLPNRINDAQTARMSQLLLRPDIIALEQKIVSNTHAISQAMATRYPDINLSFEGGSRSSTFSEMTLDQNRIYSLIFICAMTLFDSGKTKSHINEMEARAQVTATQYQKGVLDALNEVEKYLVETHYQEMAYKHLKTQYQAARAAETFIQERYISGLESILTVLEVGRKRSDVEDIMVIAQGNIWHTRVDLILALGGHWDIDQMIEQQNKQSIQTITERK